MRRSARSTTECAEDLGRGVVVGVGAVRVDVQIEVGMRGAHRPDGLEIPAGCDLQLDAAVTRVRLPLHLREQGVDAWLDAERNTGDDLGAGSAECAGQ